MHHARRHRSPTLRSAIRQCCAHVEDSDDELIGAVQCALVQAAEIGALGSDAEQAAALTVAAGVLGALIEDDEDFHEAVGLLADTLALVTA